MSYTLLDDELPESAKWAALSDAAFRFGIRALCWARRPKQMRLRPGFIPEAMAAHLSMRPPAVAKKLARELVNAGVGIHENGILVPVDGGWMIHDFKQYGEPKVRDGEPQEHVKSPARSEAARLAGLASAESRRTKNGTAQPVRSNESNGANNLSPNEAPNQLPNGATNVAERSHRTSPNAGRSSSQDLSQDIRSPITKYSKESTTSLKTGQVIAREQPIAVVVESVARIPCPPDLKLLPAQRQTLESGMIPGWAIDASTQAFVANNTADPSDVRTIEVWRKCCGRACWKDWNDPQRRPKPPVDDSAAQQRKAEEARQRRAAEQAESARRRDAEAQAELAAAGIDTNLPVHDLIKNLAGRM